MSRIAVVLFNLGGPDSLQAVRPFLKNLFSDPAIIAAPAPVRWFLARLISTRRAPVARKIYEHMGGRSPILPETEAQADALRAALMKNAPDHQWHVSIAMRYWHPTAAAAAAEVSEFGPDRIVLLPLYPQFSTTTTGSSAEDWARAALGAGLDVPTSLLCCYPDDPGFVAAVARLTAESIADARNQAPSAPLKVLFSAHGLPKRVIATGDPYQWQVERTVAAVQDRLGTALEGAQTMTCFQSRVGPLEWIGPATDQVISQAGAAGAAIVVVPIAFVSEHSETLVELDIEYRHLAERAGAAAYVRVPAVGTDPDFIEGLAQLAEATLAREGVASGRNIDLNSRVCPDTLGRCAQCP
ncbi:MAG: ferrochelatase [Alphaproteobacteria bacterium]|jgi:ferrochelatase